MGALCDSKKRTCMKQQKGSKIKRITGYILALLLLTAFGAAPACASLIFSASGTSAKGVAVEFGAELTISDNLLTVKLTNESPVASLNPDDLLASFYFDIVDVDSILGRPTPGYVSATGAVYEGNKDGPDSGPTFPDLRAFNKDDGTWQFKTMDEDWDPFLGFGIGTVGNNTLSPNNFNGNIVGTGPIDYAIYTGDITTQNLDGHLLVKDTATFTFDGLDGFTEDDIVRRVAFGLGTAPDSTIEGTVVPIPGAVWLLGSGLVGLIFLRRKRLVK